MKNVIKDFRWYHNNIDNNDRCIYPNDGDMCIYIVGTASNDLEYILIYRDLAERTLRCRLSLYSPQYIGLSNSKYDLILSNKDKIKLMSILNSNVWNTIIDFLKEEYAYPEYQKFDKDISKLPSCPPNYLLL